MDCPFIVGQKVVFKKDYPQSEIDRARCEGVTLPRTGVIYTIRDMEPGVRKPSDIFIRLNELVNQPHVIDGIEPSFLSSHFAPVVERKTDISKFQAMLIDKKQPISA